MINLLTMCRRAGKLITGFDAVSDAVRNGKAFCVMNASDISANTFKEISFICHKYNIRLIPCGLTKEELGTYLGKITAVLAVCDAGFAKGFVKISENL